jgi:ComF family protein
VKDLDFYLKELIINFKYEGKRKLKKVLGFFLFLYFQEYLKNLSISCIIPVPLHEKRRKMRGFNQSQLLAEELHKYINIPLETEYLFRSKNNPPLYTMSATKRKQILKDGFSLKKKININGDNVLIIDDILTTGSTVNQISSLLKTEARVNKVYVLTLASGFISNF